MVGGGVELQQYLDENYWPQLDCRPQWHVCAVPTNLSSPHACAQEAGRAVLAAIGQYAPTLAMQSVGIQ